jgi:hypothetical protein
MALYFSSNIVKSHRRQQLPVHCPDHEFIGKTTGPELWPSVTIAATYSNEIGNKGCRILVKGIWNHFGTCFWISRAAFRQQLNNF